MTAATLSAGSDDVSVVSQVLPKRIKLLFLINSLGPGGAERVLVNLVNRLDLSKYEVTVRVLFDEGDNRQHLSAGIRYEKVFKKAFRGVNLLGRIPGRYIYNLVAGGSFDVVVVYLHGVLTRIVASAPAGQPTIAYLHANMESSPFMRGFRDKEQIQRCFRTYDAVVSVSESVDESFRAASGMSGRLHVIHNVFDTEAIRSSAAEPLCGGILADPPVMNICSVGKLTAVKGYERLVRVADTLRNDGVRFNLLIVGEGPERARIHELIERKELGSLVKLVGYDKNPYKYIARCDLFVSSSYSEGFSSVVVESIVLGTPVLATDCSGMREILGGNNEHGIVVENSEAGLLSGLRLLLHDRELLARYREKARGRAELFEPQKAVGAFEQLVASVLKDR